jgi:hypothetical protein
MDLDEEAGVEASDEDVMIQSQLSTRFEIFSQKLREKYVV